jgi:hypothetical protein
MSIVLSSTMLVSCVAETKQAPIITKVADLELIGWDNARVTDDAKIVRYAGKPLLKESMRDQIADGAVEAYCKWKGRSDSFLPVKTAVGERLVEDWRAMALPSGEVFIAGGAFKEPPGVIDQTWLLEPKTSRLKDGPQLLRARKACTLSYLSSGKILVSGGLGSAQSLNECESFDPKTQTMTKFSPLASPRNGHSIIELGNKNLLVFGGKDLHVLDTIERWSPEESSFRIIGRARNVRFEPQLFLIDAKRVLIAKGRKHVDEKGATGYAPAELYDDASVPQASESVHEKSSSQQP